MTAALLGFCARAETEWQGSTKSSVLLVPKLQWSVLVYGALPLESLPASTLFERGSALQAA
jgi:hypothetical protein